MNRFSYALCASAVFIGCTLHPITVNAPVSVGELLDKITILEIKLSKFVDPYKVENVRNEWQDLQKTVEAHVDSNPQLEELKVRLRNINEQLWDIEDKIRAKEAQKRFDEEFIRLARDVYYTNDQRSAVKREINELTCSDVIEEKGYTKY